MKRPRNITGKIKKNVMKNNENEINKKENKYCVYFHCIPNTENIFYVGYGIKRRSTDKGSRNKDWNKLVEREGGFNVKIFEDRYNLSLEEAYKLEIEFIKYFGRMGFEDYGVLVNKSIGGKCPAEGTTHKMPNWLNEKLTLINKGKKLSNETKNKISNSRKGMIFSKEHCNNISKNKINCVYSKDRDIKIGKAQKGKPKIKLQKPIFQYDLDGNFIREFNSMTEAAKSLNLKHCSGIEACCRGVIKTSSGFKWKKK